ncbi:cell division protein FtsX [Sphingomonas sp.]|uniref:cell division protein FtsX n=1 Tax=Sphingomonas sp. TaxID=28214 RepID=UPI0035C8333D
MSGKATGAVLDQAVGVGAMTWVIAVMLFLTVLAAAAGMGTRSAVRALDRQLAGRMTVQLGAGTAADPLLARLSADRDVARAVRVPEAELARLLAPWLGEDGADPDLPLPVLVDIDLADPAAATADRVAALVRAVVPDARVDRQAAWMSPVARLLATLSWLAAGLVAMMVAATALVVLLAARAGLHAHRGTIDVLHMLGSTDVQVARLFQRRIARDALAGGLGGAVAALVVIVVLGWQAADLGSELVSGISLGATGWIILALLPLGFVALAAVAARLAVLAALRRAL